jgi:hypothetical protein
MTAVPSTRSSQNVCRKIRRYLSKGYLLQAECPNFE